MFQKWCQSPYILGSTGRVKSLGRLKWVQNWQSSMHSMRVSGEWGEKAKMDRQGQTQLATPMVPHHGGISTCGLLPSPDIPASMLQPWILMYSSSLQWCKNWCCAAAAFTTGKDAWCEWGCTCMEGLKLLCSTLGNSLLLQLWKVYSYGGGHIQEASVTFYIVKF